MFLLLLTRIFKPNTERHRKNSVVEETLDAMTMTELQWLQPEIYLSSTHFR